MSRRDVLVCAALGVCLSAASTASGGNAPPDYSWEWATIGDVGNEPYVYDRQPGFPPLLMGGVDYEYRIATTQVTWGQYYEFVQAYAPFVSQDDIILLRGAGTGIQWSGSSGGVPQYELIEGRENRPAGTSWRMVARMANWLHNGAPTGAEATAADFENGAYDTSTFGREPNNGPYTDQSSRSEGAKFWIPSQDEWVKAVYYDPNRHGEGEGGTGSSRT